MDNLLDLEIFPPRARQIAGRFAASMAVSAYQSAPKRAIAGYSGLAIGLLLWLVPLAKRLPPQVTLTFTVAGAAAIATAQARLERLQDDLDLEGDRRDFDIAVDRQVQESLLMTGNYAELSRQRLALSQGLPEHLLEPDLRMPQGVEAEPAIEPMLDEMPSFAEVMGEGEQQGERSQAARSPSKYTFGKRLNPRSKVEELTVELSGHPEYCGVPIEDLAHEIAADSRGCLGVAPTGSGKTVLLRSAILAQQKIDETSDFTVFAHKSANTSRGETLDYAGVEESEDCIIFTASQSGQALEDAAFAMQSRLNALSALMESGSLVPSVVVIDQSNQGLKAAKRAGREAARQLTKREAAQGKEPAYKYLAEDYSDFIETGLVDGREKGIKLWTFGHSNTNRSQGVEHQIKKNVFYLGLGRAGNYSAVENPLSDNRFIEDAAKRNHLREQLRSYKKQHEALGSPLNVVLAITNCGDRGWKLCVLPQYDTQEDIELGVTNPPKDNMPIEEPPEPEETAPPVSEIEAFRAKLIKGAQRPSEAQVKAARAFIPWLREHYDRYVDDSGQLDPEIAWQKFSLVSSASELTIILQILSEQGAGQFYTPPGTNRMLWVPGPKLKPKMPAKAEHSLDQEKLKAIISEFEKKAAGTLHDPQSFLNGSRTLRPVHRVMVGDLKIVLRELERRGVIAYTAGDRKQFIYNGLPADE